MQPNEIMKPSEFYEKYCRIKTKDGLVPPAPLTKGEIEFMDNAAEKGYTNIHLMRKRRRDIEIDIAKMNLCNQPK